MKINQVEELVAITKKNIRFYEDQGLLNPERNPENGYREYALSDVERLLKIKLLRKLAVPLEEIRTLFQGKQSLADCMDKQLTKLTGEQANLEIMKQLCEELKQQPVTIDQLAATEYLEEMEKMEKEGMEFLNIEQEDVIRKKKYGAGLSAAFVIIPAIVVLFAMLWAGAATELPVWAVIIFVIMLILPIVGVSIALGQRIKELNGGEENEASKY